MCCGIVFDDGGHDAGGCLHFVLVAAVPSGIVVEVFMVNWRAKSDGVGAEIGTSSELGGYLLTPVGLHSLDLIGHGCWRAWYYRRPRRW